MGGNSFYRKAYPRFWVSVRGLGPLGKLVAKYLIDGPQTNRIGLYNFSEGKALEDLEMEYETFSETFQATLKMMGWKYDKKSRVLYIPTWWRWNAPENPNVLKGNLKDLLEVAKSPLISEFYSNTEFLTPNLLETFKQTLPQTVPKSETETETETEYKKTSTSEIFLNVTPNVSKEGKVKRTSQEVLKAGYSPGFLKFWQSYPNRKGGKEKAWQIWQGRKKGKRLPPVEALLKALEVLMNSEDWLKDEGRYVPMITTFLNQGRWTDAEGGEAGGVEKHDPACEMCGGTGWVEGEGGRMKRCPGKKEVK